MWRWIPLRMRVALMVQWTLLGGNLLTPESLLLILYIAGWWPAQQSEPGGRDETPAAKRRVMPWNVRRAPTWKLPATGPTYSPDGKGLR